MTGTNINGVATIKT